MAKDDVTVIFVTHSATSAEKVCNRGIVLEAGKLAFDGPIREALEYYEGPDALAVCSD